MWNVVRKFVWPVLPDLKKIQEECVVRLPQKPYLPAEFLHRSLDSASLRIQLSRDGTNFTYGALLTLLGATALSWNWWLAITMGSVCGSRWGAPLAFTVFGMAFLMAATWLCFVGVLRIFRLLLGAEFAWPTSPLRMEAKAAEWHDYHAGNEQEQKPAEATKESVDDYVRRQLIMAIHLNTEALQVRSDLLHDAKTRAVAGAIFLAIASVFFGGATVWIRLSGLVPGP